MDKSPGWERRYYNSYGNYMGYRFQDFRSGCRHRDNNHGGMCNAACRHPEHTNAHEELDYRECCCDLCPCVEKDYDDEDPNEPNWSEGEQPVLVIETPNVEFSGTPAALSPEAPLERRVGGCDGKVD